MPNSPAVIGAPTVHDVVEDTNLQTLTAQGTISISDANAGQTGFKTSVVSASGNLGTLSIAANGAYVYSVADGKVQYLGAGETKTDTFTVTSLDGTQKQVTFLIHGINDAAVIGTPNAVDVTEDATSPVLKASGSISISDADQNQAAFKTAVVAASGNLGTLVLQSNGSYTYSVANGATQYLGAGQTKVDTFTVTSLDGTQKQISFNVHGINDAAVIGTPTLRDVYEDAKNPTLTATGSISISDADQGQAAFSTSVTAAPGTLGNLVVSSNGAYTYSVANGASQYLGAGDIKVDTFTVTSIDGTQKQVSFTIHGTNDAAVIGVPTVHDVTESATAPLLLATGTVSISDADQGESAFRPAIVSGSGNLGILAIGPNGDYVYGVLNSDVKYLDAGQVKIDTFTLTALDGTQKQVSFTIHGIGGATANHAAVIGIPDHAVLVEDSSPTTLSVTGTISITDVDAGQGTFQTVTTPAPGTLGTLTLQASGAYTYSIANSVVQYLGAGEQRVETFTVKSADGTVKDVSFTVTGLNDAASISSPAIHDVTEDAGADQAGNLKVSGTLTATDADQGQSAFQTGAAAAPGNLGSLSFAADGTYTYSVANSLTQSMAAGETKIDTFTIHSLDGTPKTVSFTIHGTADAAVIGDPTFHDVTEDSAPTLSVSGQMTATDADHDQSTFNTTIAPTPGNLGHLTITADGHYTYSIDNAAVQGLAAGEVKVETFTVSSIDGTTRPVSFTIHGTQDAPVLNVATAAGQADDARIALHIDAHTIETGSLGIVVITGIPDTYTLNHGSFVLDGAGDGHWEVPSDVNTLSDLALVPGPDAQAGTLTLHVSVASIEGGHQMAAEAAMTVEVTGGEHAVTQRAVDGYIAGAFVFADANGNGIFDADEASATTNADGSFTLHNAHGTLIMTGGIDVSTGLAFTGTLKAPEGSTVVTPLTTLITALAVGDVTAAQATAQVAAAFGIDTSSGIVLTAYDPVPAAIAGDNPVATAILSAGIQVQSTVAQISAVGATSNVFEAIADAITNAGTGGTIDLSAGTTVAAIVSDSGVNGTAAAVVTNTVSAANDSIQAATNVTQLAQAGQVAQGVATTDLAAAAAGNFSDTDQLAAIHDNYVNPVGLASQLAAAQVAVLAPVFGTSGSDVLTGTADIDTIDGREGNDQISGGDGADVLLGGAGNDRLTGNAGNDRIDGGQGFDRAVYSDAAAGVTINMAGGKASGTGVDNDALTNVEGIVGSRFADTYDAAGFTGDSGVAGSPVGFNEFEGGAGDDVITGTVNALGIALTRISYVGATSGVTVDVAAGVADGDASVGHDTFGTAGINGAWGSSHNDTLLGSANANGSVEVFSGMAGDDLINGRGGFDRADYNTDPATTSGIVVHLAAGTVAGDATIGNDTLLSVEAIRGTNFADTYDAAGFGTIGSNIGSNGTFNEFTGNGGNDTIIGNGNTRISFNNATAGVTVDLQAGSASGDASVGTDTFTGVNAVQGSNFADTMRGDAANNTFTGNAGDDFIDGRTGFDVASYNNSYFVTGGVTVNMADGTAKGGASIGNDTFKSIEGVQGTGYADTYNAVGYGAAGASNIGNNGTFNQFEGVGGNDTIIGNGNTRVIYGSAAAAVTVDLSLGTAHGTAAGDNANVGTDAFTGVFSATGSAFGDTLIGDANSNMFVGGGGNDAIDGGAGADVAIFSGGRGQYNVSINGAGQVTVTDTIGGRDGTDSLTNVEALQFTNATVLVASGAQAAPVDLSDGRLFFNAAANPLVSATGSADDFVKINQGLSGHQIDLGAGTHDTVMLGVTGGYGLNLVGVENLVGTGGGDSVTLASVANGLSIDMGGGNDSVSLANGSNSLSATNLEILTANDFAAGNVSNDTLTLLNGVSGLSVNLGNGNNALNLAAGANSFTNIFGTDTINGTASDDALTVASGLYTPNNDMSVDLGAGDDTLSVGSQYGNLALHGVEHLVVTGQPDAFYILTNGQNGLAVDLGTGNSGLQIASGANTLALTHVSSVGSADFFGGAAPASDDTLTLTNDVSGVVINLQQGDDTLNLTGFNGGVTIANVEHVNGGVFTDIITVAGTVGATVTGGGSSDFITAGAGDDVIRYTDASDSSPAYAPDTVTNFDAAHDQFLLDGVAGLAGSVHFMASGVLDGSPATPHAEAILVDVGGQSQLQIDVDGDGTIGAADLVINLNGLSGTLGDANFAVITPNHAPADILLAGTIVPENAAPGSLVGVLSEMDPDAGDTASYVLTDDAGGLFAISNGTVVTTAPLNFEQAASHQITVQVTDHAGAIFSKSFQIGVTDVNEAPTDVAISNASVAENSAAATVVGVLTAADPDAASTATYTLVDDAGGLFDLVANQLVTTAPLDFEQAASHQVTVRATDAGGLSVDKTFVVATTNVNESPTTVLLSNSSVAENTPAGTVVGALSALDPDAGDTATFTLVVNPGGLFAVSNGQLVTAAALDFEQAPSHQVTVRATDAGGLTHDTVLTIATTNVNEAPTDIVLSNATVPQGAANGTIVGSLSALDPDAGDHVAFTLADDDGGQFSVVGGNLVVAGPLTAGTQHVTVHATDAGGASFDKIIAVNVSSGLLRVGTPAADTLTGDVGDDTLQGQGGNDKLQGLGGNDILDGGQGFDRAVYTDATAGITANLAAGTVTGGSGSDTLIGIESIVGSDFADTINTAGFAGDSGIAGNPLGLNEIEGRGGNDTIVSDVNGQGALLTRVSYIGAAAGVTVDLAAGNAHGTAAGDAANVGTDTLVGSGFSTVIGSLFGDTLLGTNNANGTVEIFDGRAGNDTINGRGGFDRADYALDPATNSGITVNLFAGTVVGDRQGTGDVTIGSDTLISIESVRGTNFADSFNAAGFNGGGVNPGSNGTFNEFNGMGGNDSITGNGNTRLAFVNATGAVTVDIAAGTDSGDLSTGSDTFSGVNAVQASMFDDTIFGSNSTASTETFAGLGGDDFIDGRGGFDLATYNNIYFSTGPVTVNMGAGTATGDASVGTDTLRSIEAVQGTNFNDVFNASTFGTGGALNIGNNGTFNQFEGLGGNDTVTGNGNTRLIYSSAAAGVTIHLAAGTATGDVSVGTDSFTAVNSATGSQFADTYDAAGFLGGVGTSNTGNFNLFEGLGGNDTVTGNGNTRIAYTQAANGVSVDLSAGNAHSIAASDVAAIGVDVILGGVNSVQGSNFNDIITGGTANEFLFGGAGADTLNGGGGNDTLTGQGGNDGLDGGVGTDMASFTGARAGYTVTTDGVTGVTTVKDNVGGEGTDTLTNVEVLQFSDATVLLSAGTALNPVDISPLNLGPGPIVGTGADDFLAVGGNVFGHQIDLGAGANDTVSLASPNFYQLNLANVERVTGSTGNDNLNLVANAAGLAVDLGDGLDNMTLAGGVNSLSVANVEILTTNDFSGPAVSDTLTLLNNVGGGMNVNLAQGDNTLNLAAGGNTFVDIYNVQHVNGTALDDTLTLTDTIYEPGSNPIIDLGGGFDVLNIGSQYGVLSALNVEQFNGNALDNGFTLNNNVDGIAVDLGGGSDHLSLANGVNTISMTNVESVSASDFSGLPSDDVLTLLDDVSGLSINLGTGTNTVNLAAGANSLDGLFNIVQLNGSASDDALTLTQQSFATVFDMGAGNDTISFGGTANGVTVTNAETVNGSAGNDFITIGNTAGATTITGGAGADTITASAATDNFNFNSVADSQTGNGDTVVNFDAANDTFTFTNMSGANGFAGPIHFVDTAAFDGSTGSPHSEARIDQSGGNATLQIDVNGDGVMDSNDIEIHLTSYAGTLHDQNFMLA